MADALLDAVVTPSAMSNADSGQLNLGVEQSQSSMTLGIRPVADYVDQGPDSGQELAQDVDGSARRQFSFSGGGGRKPRVSRSASLAKPGAAIPDATRGSTAAPSTEALLYIGEVASSSASFTTPVISLKQLPPTDDLSFLVGGEAGSIRFSNSVLERVMHAAQPASHASSHAGDTSLAEWHDK